MKAGTQICTLRLMHWLPGEVVESPSPSLEVFGIHGDVVSGHGGVVEVGLDDLQGLFQP